LGAGLKQGETTHVDQQLRELYRSLQIPMGDTGSLQALDSLGLIHLIDKIEAHFAIRVSLVDLDPVRMSQHSYLMAMVTKYVTV
jgi:acyl carrier protein